MAGAGAGAVAGATSGAAEMWRSACHTLRAPATEQAWRIIQSHSPPDTVWHSLNNCISHQARVWTDMLSSGTHDAVQPAAFKMALVLRHTPPELLVPVLSDLLRLHPQSQDLTSYVLALLTDDEPGCSCDMTGSGAEAYIRNSGPAPLRDLQLFGDCELAVLAAPRARYEAHAKLVRAEYTKLSNQNYVELRIKVLNQFAQIPQLYHTPEFSTLETAARENIEREINELREELLTYKKH